MIRVSYFELTGSR